MSNTDIQLTLLTILVCVSGLGNWFLNYTNAKRLDMHGEWLKVGNYPLTTSKNWGIVFI